MSTNLKWRLAAAQKAVADLAAEVGVTIADNERMKTPFGKAQAAKEIPFLKHSYDVTMEAHGWSSGIRGWSDAEREYKEALVVAKENDAADAANAELLKKLVAIIEGCGISPTYRKWTGKRRKEYDHVTLDWKDALQAGLAPSYAGTASVEKKCQELSVKRADFLKTKDAQAKAAEAAEARTRLERERVVLVADCARELGIENPAHADPGAIIDHMRKADKYFDLAYAMLLTRGDWSDGFYRVRDALERFVAADERDRIIVGNVSSRLDDDDGRCFRDCDWNYDRIFGLAKPAYVEIAKRLEFPSEVCT